jgi:hypothetical protein
MHICDPKKDDESSTLAIKFSWDKDCPSKGSTLCVPLHRCVEKLKEIVMSMSEQVQQGQNQIQFSLEKLDGAQFWECKIEDLDLETHSRKIVDTVKQEQAKAAYKVIQNAVARVLDKDCTRDEVTRYRNAGFVHQSTLYARQVFRGLLFACMLSDFRESAWGLLTSVYLHLDDDVISSSLASFFSEPSEKATMVGMEFIEHLVQSKDRSRYESLFDVVFCSLCEMCCSAPWSRQAGLQNALYNFLSLLGREFGRKHEVRVFNAALVPLKTVPRELSSGSIRSFRRFVSVCSLLYGVQWQDDVLILDDSLQRRETADLPSCKNENSCDCNDASRVDTQMISERKEKANIDDVHDSKTQVEVKFTPCDEVFRILVHELASTQQLLRSVMFP